jgi:ABC-type transport system involved in cytochrome c biogenesis permease subunit
MAHARVGGAGAVAGLAERSSMGEVLDGVTMLLTEVSFVMLWAGIVMGAIWADHSWGRPWGWDPKEVFALNTFVIFALLIHVRWKVQDKGLWTAILAVAGAAVMLFNWIVINFVISGLHSYA